MGLVRWAHFPFCLSVEGGARNVNGTTFQACLMMHLALRLRLRWCARGRSRVACVAWVFRACFVRAAGARCLRRPLAESRWRKFRLEHGCLSKSAFLWRKIDLERGHLRAWDAFSSGKGRKTTAFLGNRPCAHCKSRWALAEIVLDVDFAPMAGGSGRMACASPAVLR